MDSAFDEQIARAANAVARAEAIVIAAGAGMGVDSGLPDFRGYAGFWRAYPIAKRLGLDFAEMANPRWFLEDPPFAWGFYGHRRNLYRETQPHAGFMILRKWLDRTPSGGFVFTSNVDGHFQKAGFSADRIVECHGSIERLQCLNHCGASGFPADTGVLTIDSTKLRASEPLPKCPQCSGLARPNILMFGDWDWDSKEANLQNARFQQWLSTVRTKPLVIVECGAGQAIPTVRDLSERLVDALGATLIRINLRDSDVPPGQISLPTGALHALEAIDRILAE